MWLRGRPMLRILRYRRWGRPVRAGRAAAIDAERRQPGGDRLSPTGTIGAGEIGGAAGGAERGRRHRGDRAPTRDHTERMLRAFGHGRGGGRRCRHIRLAGGQLSGGDPGPGRSVASAAFRRGGADHAWLRGDGRSCSTACAPAFTTLDGNGRRSDQRMQKRSDGGECVGDVTARYLALKGIVVLLPSARPR